MFQAKWTGTQILGRPHHELRSDPKLAHVIDDSIKVGEIYAHASLSAEYFCLAVRYR